MDRTQGTSYPATPDEEWLAAVGRRGGIVLTKDIRIRYKPNEKEAILEAGAVAVILVSGNMKGKEILELFVYPTYVPSLVVVPHFYFSIFFGYPFFTSEKNCRNDPLSFVAVWENIQTCPVLVSRRKVSPESRFDPCEAGAWNIWYLPMSPGREGFSAVIPSTGTIDNAAIIATATMIRPISPSLVGFTRT